jgi:hypothetical protein
MSGHRRHSLTRVSCIKTNRRTPFQTDYVQFLGRARLRVVPAASRRKISEDILSARPRLRFDVVALESLQQLGRDPAMRIVHERKE